jgi:Stress responsive A/B Barrel Domain
MIAHVVLFEPKPDLTDADRSSLLEGLREAARDIPSVRQLRVGRRIRHGLAGYEQSMLEEYSFAAIIEFDSVDGLRSYLSHPAHERVGRHFSRSSVRAIAYDYRLVDVAAGAELFR